jgi:hypothetical protein
MHLVRTVVALLAILPLFACGDDQPARGSANIASPEQDPVTQPPTDAPPAAQALMAQDREPTKTEPVVAPDLEVFEISWGQTYSTGLILLRLNTNNTFEMKEAFGNERLTGRYTYERGILILSDPQGSVGNTRFPMRCQVERLGAGAFRVAESDGTCILFRNQTFRLSTE